MRNDSAVTEGTLLDPIWEFILDDYDDLEVAPKARTDSKSRFGFRKEKKKVEDTNIFDAFLGSIGDYSDYDSASQQSSRLDSRDEADNYRSTRNVKQTSWRRNQFIEKQESESSMWNLFSMDGIETNKKPTGTDKTIRKSGDDDSNNNNNSNNNNKKKRFSLRGGRSKEEKAQSRNSEQEKTRTRTPERPTRQPVAPPLQQKVKQLPTPVKQQQQLPTPATTVVLSPKTKRKGGLFRRFRKADQFEAEVEKAKASATERRKKAAEEIRTTESVRPAQRQLTKEVSKTSRNSRNADLLDPIQMFLEVAGKLDPFASDHDSESESFESLQTGRTDDRTDTDTLTGTETTESVADSQQRQPQQKRQLQHHQRQPPTPPVQSGENNAVNEIRLNFQPVPEDADVAEEEDIQESMDESRQGPEEVPENTESIGSPEDEEAEALHQVGTIARPAFPSDEVQRAPPENSTMVVPKSSPTRIDDDQGTASSHQSLFRRLMCCQAKKHLSDEVFHQLGTADAKEVFPATRMVSDDNVDFEAVTGDGADYVNGVMGVPSDRFIYTTGPQSLYEYDYGTYEHMDVFYTVSGLAPRVSMQVRRHNAPPTLNSSLAGHDVVVQIEASTVSETDCAIRQGYWWGSEEPPADTVPGVDFVGKIFQIRGKTEMQYGLKPRDTVLSLTKWGGNSRYITIDPEHLVRVPDGVDPAEAACLPEMYLTAFQALHFGQVGPQRYKKTSLTGKSILIVGSMANNMGKAIIELALNAGVANIYATAKKKHWKTIISFGIMPLSQEPLEWISRVEGTIDLILAPSGGPREDISPVHYRALRPREGQLILCGHRLSGNDLPVGEWEQRQPTVVCTKQKEETTRMNQSHSYDVYEQWDKNLTLCKKDLEHLLLLLKYGVFKPAVLDRLPLLKVPRAHELLELKRLTGFLVCEPWMKSKKRAVYL